MKARKGERDWKLERMSEPEPPGIDGTPEGSPRLDLSVDISRKFKDCALWMASGEDSSVWDCILLADDGTRVAATKKDLCVFSDVFQRMFLGGFAEATERLVNVRDVPGKVLEAVIGCHYTGKIALDLDNLVDVSSFCHRMGFVQVLAACGHYMRLTLSPWTAIQYWELAEKYGIMDIDALVMYVARNLLDVQATGTLECLPLELLLSLLKRDDLAISTELDVLAVITAWGRRQASRAAEIDLHPSVSSEMTTFPPSPCAYVTSFGPPDQAPGSPAGPMWAPPGSVPRGTGPGLGAGACAKKLDRIPTCLFDTIRQEVMTPNELWQLREGALATGSVGVLASMAEALLRRISVDVDELHRSVWPTHVIHRKLYHCIITTRIGTRIAWHGQAESFTCGLSNEWELRVERLRGSWRPELSLYCKSIRPGKTAVDAMYTIDLFCGPRGPEAELLARFSGARTFEPGKVCCFHTLSEENVRDFQRFAGQDGILLQTAVQIQPGRNTEYRAVAPGA